jgi:hypothetical protein
VLAADERSIRQEGSIEVRCTDCVEFKVGVLPDHKEFGVVQTLSEGEFVLTRRAAISSENNYAHGRRVEIFTAPQLSYFEIESHSPCVVLKPNAACEMVAPERVGRLLATSDDD